MKTAQEWKKTPSEWDSLSDDDKLEMMSETLTTQSMTQWTDYLQEKLMKRNK